MESVVLLTAWAQLLVRTLEELGIEHVVISPGSRSTPLTWALSQSARIEHSLVIDERSAAFTALGRAKYSGKPCALLCTSGSAAANYLPAIVESSLAHTPLLVITADRPFELQDRGAPQTIDQVKLYGGFVRAFFDLGMPDESLGALRALRSTVAQAVHRTLEPVPGAVHINFRARKPLEPHRETPSPLATRIDEACQVVLSPISPATCIPSAEAIRTLAARCAAAQRGVITLGPQDLHQQGLTAAVLELIHACNFTVLFESAGQLRHALPAAQPTTQFVALAPERHCDAFDWIYASDAGRSSTLLPDFVLQIGNTPTSSAWQDLLARSNDLELHILCEHSWPDPTARARTVLQGSLPASLRALTKELVATALCAPSAWHQKLAAANRVTWQIIETGLARMRAGSSLAEPVAVRCVMDQLKSSTLLALGNSLPVREVDQYAPASSRELRVLSQRGANGIDGVLSSATGAAQVHSGPTLCLLGDISYLHDVGALWAARDVKTPFVIAILNNQGGRIFEQLPLLSIGAVSEQVAAAWITPHQLDLTAGATLFGLRSLSVNSEQTLTSALQEALQTPGATVIDIRVSPSSARDARAELLTECSAALRLLLS